MARVNIPGVGLVDFPDDMSDDDIAGAIKTNILPSVQATPAAQPQPTVLPPEDTSSDFVRGVKNILPQIQETYGGAKVLAGKVAGDKEMMKSGMEHMQAGQQKQVTKETDEFTKAWEKGIGSVVTDYLPYMAGSGVGSMLETIASMGIGMGAGAIGGGGIGAIPGALTGAIGKSLLKKGVKEEAEKIIARAATKEAGELAAEEFIKAEAKKSIVGMAGTAGIAAQAGTHGAGEVTSRAVGELQQQGKTAEDLDLGRVLPAAVVHGIADFAADKIGLGALKGVGSGTNSFLWDVTKAIGVTGTKELVPEEIQTIAERYGAKLSLADAEAFKEYLNTGMASYAMSVVPGGVGGVRNYIAGRPTKPEEEKKTEETGTPPPPPPPADVVDANKPPPPPPPPAAADETVKESIYDVPKKEAGDYLAELDAGKKASFPTLQKHIKALGLDIPEAGPNRNQRSIDLLKAHLAQGAEDVVQQTDTGAGGVSSTISGGPTTTTPAGGIAGAGRAGMASDQGTTPASQDRTGSQQPALDYVAWVNQTYPNGIPSDKSYEDLKSEHKIYEQNHRINELDKLISEEEKAAAYATSRAALDEARVGPPVRNEAFQTISPGETQAALEREQAAAKADEEARQAALQDIAGAKIPQTKTEADIREEYELSRQALVDQDVQIPEWKKLTADERDRYLGNLPVNPSAQDFDNAAKDLAAYKEQKADSDVAAKDQRVVNGYEENRETFQRSLGIDLPAWSGLSPEAQNIYLSNVKKNSPVEQDAGFEAVAAQLEKEGKGIRQVSREGVRNLQLKGHEEVAKAKAAERIAREAAAEASAQGKGETLSEETKTKLINGDINGVLSDLIASAGGFKGLNLEKGDKTYRQAYAYLANIRKRASALTFRIIAGSLNKLSFNSKVVTDTNNKVIQRLQAEGKLAEYNPKTDTFYFTPEGFDESTVLHEIVHAGTVKIINQYLTDPSKLTKDQREAAEHLQKIYDHSKKRLGGKFKNAYENLYEFVSYAMTDNKFQIALAEMQVRPLAKYTGMAMKAWQQFTQALSKMFGLYDAKAQTEELTAEMYQQVAKEYGSMDPDELYQNEVMDEVESLDLGPITAPTLSGPGRETEAKVVKQRTVKQARKFLTTYPGYEGNLLLEMSEVFGRILAAPQKGIKVEPLAAKKQTKEEEAAQLHNDEEIIAVKGEKSAYSQPVEHQSKNFKYFKNLLFTRSGWRRIATKLQNDRYEIKHWQDMLDLAGKIAYAGKDKINNIYTQLTLATGRAKNLYNSRIEGTYEKLDKAIYNFSKATGLDIEGALDSLHRILEALHEPERRVVKYLMTVPLSTNKNYTTPDNRVVSAADRRDEIFKDLNTKKLSTAEAETLRSELDAIVFTKDQSGKVVPNMVYVDPLGSSPKQAKKPDGTVVGVATDIENEIYNVTGLSPKTVAARLDKYNKFEFKSQVDEIAGYIDELNKTTSELNKEANYWSQPVSNRVAFYGFKHYVPLKGIAKASDADEMLDFDGARMGKELQDIAQSFDGRVSVSNNPVLQTMSDAVRAAMRAGRKDLTQSIKNSLGKSPTTVDGKKVDLNPNGQGLLHGRVVKTISFEDRQNKDVIDALPRENTVFHYNEDGSIDVLEINDKKLREAIRRTYKDTNPLVDVANNITSKLGMLHTRYNYNFAPLNFVRDALTNAWTMGAEMGPKEAAKFLGEIAGRVVGRGSLQKAMKVAALYESKNIDKIKELAAKDPVVKDMYDFIEEGGMVEYLQGISLKSNFQALQREVGRSGVMRTAAQLNKYIDIWTDMFELSSRSAAFAIAKKNFMSKGLDEKAAATKAAAYAKNLANFEQVGEHGKALGAVFMFFRPSATGAVRAIEAVVPAFQNVDRVMAELPSNLSAEDKATFKKNFLEQQKAARYMTAYLMGAGALAYTMSMMMADDDDLGRNKVMNDDTAQWTRFARFHTPFSDTPLQLPWGFGLGSFMASGAQLAAVASGHQDMGKALSNIATQISLDSFVPIPFSRMNVADNPALWVLDSITPSMLRPALEFVVNKNGLGQDIYNDSNRRMGDAYMGGDNIPESYKAIARQIFDTFEIDVSPNSLYFLANSYMDGPSRVIDAIVNGFYLAAGEKEFKAKTDVPFIGSFIGAEPNVDGREFASIEKQIQSMESKLKMLEAADIDKYDAYLDKHPLDEEIVDFYNKEVGKHLNKLRKEANEIRVDKYLTPKERALELKENKIEQNLIKYEMIQQFKEYGLKPQPVRQQRTPRQSSLVVTYDFTRTPARFAPQSKAQISSAGRSVGIKKLFPTSMPSNGSSHSGSIICVGFNIYK